MRKWTCCPWKLSHLLLCNKDVAFGKEPSDYHMTRFFFFFIRKHPRKNLPFWVDRKETTSKNRQQCSGVRVLIRWLAFGAKLKMCHNQLMFVLMQLGAAIAPRDESSDTTIFTPYKKADCCHLKISPTPTSLVQSENCLLFRHDIPRCRLTTRKQKWMNEATRIHFRVLFRCLALNQLFQWLLPSHFIFNVVETSVQVAGTR